MDTIDRFSCEKIETVIECLSKPPSTGQKNWRLTPDTISEWMAISIERESERLEREHQKHKTKTIEFTAPEDLSDETKDMIQKFLDGLKCHQMAPLPEGYAEEFGQRKPKKVAHSSGYVQPTKERVIEHKLQLQWMRECFDPITGERNENYLSFEEWEML